MTFQEIREKDEQFVMHTYARYPVAIDHGEGAAVYDVDGNRYLDFTSGIGVCSVGYSNPRWISAVEEQIHKLGHISNLFYTEPCVRLAEKLCMLSGMSRVFFANSGAEANEGAIKLARKYSFDKYGEGRQTVISLKNSFHGRTITTLKATGQEKFHNYFFPFPEGFRYAPANDLDALIKTAGDDTCAVLVEGVQGEGGVLPLDWQYLKALRKLCDERDWLLLADEVQTGVGRTGAMFCYQSLGYTPDVATLAKGLAGGLPMGAVLAGEKVSDVLGPGTHGSTFGGNPVCCAAALAVLEEIQAAVPTVTNRGELIRRTLNGIESPLAAGPVRGMGLMLGLPLKDIAPSDMAKKLLGRGLLCLTAGSDTLRMLPPLTITEEELREGLAILKSVLTEKGE